MVARMPSALDTIAHVILPNVMKLKGASVVVSAMERRDVSMFAPVWQQTGVTHEPQVLAKQANRTLLAERQGQKHTRLGDGPVLTGDAEADAKAFVDCFMELIVPTKVTRR